jgi:hypothetical protein
MNRNKLTRRQAVTLIGTGVMVPFTGYKERPSSSPVRVSEASGDLSDMSLGEVARRIQSRDLSPVDLTRLMLDRIAGVDPQLKSYATVMRDQALADAGAAVQEIEAGG